MEDDTKESAKFGVSLEQKPPQIVEEELKLPAARQDPKNASSVITT